MTIQNPSDPSPLSQAEIQKIDRTNLSVLQKHHIRLLAHCLESFKVMKGDSPKENILPDYQQQRAWCLKNPKLSKDKEFMDILLNQFAAAAVHLDQVAIAYEISPLELTLDDLIDDALKNQ